MGRGESIGAEAMTLLPLVRERAPSAILYLTSSDATAEGLVAFVAAAMPDLGTVHLPAWDCLPYDWASPSAGVMGRRLRAISLLAEGRSRLVIASPEALLQRLPPQGAVDPRTLRVGEALDLDALAVWAGSSGYLLRDRVDEPGEIARQGRILDLFPAGLDRPYRIRFRDGAIDAISPSIRTRNAATGRWRASTSTRRRSFRPRPCRRTGPRSAGANTGCPITTRRSRRSSTICRVQR